MPLAVLINPDDPIFDFEHMMAHREYFAIMEQLSHFSVLPYQLDPSFNVGDPARNWNLNHQQAHNDFNTDLPSNYNDGYTLTTVTPSDVTGTGNSTGTTTLQVTGASGTIIIPSSVSGTGVPAGTTIIAEQSAGVYTTNQVTTLTNVALTFHYPPYQQATPAANAGTFGIHQPGILLEGTPDQENRTWWTFANHQQHYVANEAVLPLPTTAPTTAGTPPGQATVSNPWWWASRAPVIFPYW